MKLTIHTTTKKQLLLSSLLMGSASLFAQQVKETPLTSDSLSTQQNPAKKEEGSRNVMLNASNASGPREISIGLPGGDVSVLQNGLPAVYHGNPHNVTTHWRSDASLSRLSLMKISETAITTGNVGYAVNSYTNMGTDDFSGKFNYTVNQFGSQQFDLNLSGALGKGWYYSGSVYQNFDKGSFDLNFTDFHDRTQIYKGALTRRFNDNKGSISLMYHYSNSMRLTTATSMAPFIYVGDGSVQEIPGFSLGTSSYLPSDGKMEYIDMITGEKHKTKLNDEAGNNAHDISLMSDYTFDNGLNLKVNAKYMKSTGSLVYQTPTEIKQVTATDGYRVEGSGDTYEGYMQTRMSCLNSGSLNEGLFTAEISKQNGSHKWRVGVNEWFYHADYRSNTTMYDHEVAANPRRLTHDVNNTPTTFYDYNANASEYYKGYENKLALYATDDWNLTDRLNVYYGARLEYYKVNGQNVPFGRYSGFHIGSVNPTTGETATLSRFDHNWLNMVYTLSATYRITDRFGLTGDFTYNTQHPRLENFASNENPDLAQITVPLGRGGIYYNNSWMSLTSLVSYIMKQNSYSRMNLINPDGSGEIKATAFNYDIQTLGWTTDVEMNPFKNFNLHFMFTYQKPTYKKYEASVTFDNGTIGEVNATGNNVTEIPEVLIEIDPSYNITKDLRLWASFRYFSKTYANLSNALYFNGRWETFGGVNWTVNKYLKLNATAINFLNQKGASGSISGSELIGKEEAARFSNTWMAGSYLRPFTVELSANITF